MSAHVPTPLVGGVPSPGRPPKHRAPAGGRSLLLVALLGLLCLGVSAPLSPTLAEGEEARLADGKVVVQQDLPPARDGGVRTRAIAEVDASPDDVWVALLDFQARVPENSALKKVEVYKEEKAGAVLKRWARWDLKVIGTEIVFHNAYVLDTAQSYLEWNLDDSKDNDLEFSWGSYQVVPSTLKPGKSRLIYVSESDSGRAIPRWLRKDLAENSMAKLIEGIRDRAQGG